jgi:hypothetical protein
MKIAAQKKLLRQRKQNNWPKRITDLRKVTYQFTIQIAEEHIKYALSKFFFRNFKKTFLIFGVLGVLVVVMYLQAREVNGFIGAFLGLLVFSAIFLFFFYNALAKKLLARLKKFGGTVNYEFTEDFCKTKSGWASTEIKWEAFHTIWIFPKVWMLVSRDMGYFTFPVEQISSEIREFLKRKIISVGGKIK